METRNMAKKGLYVGTGLGLILFVLVGFFSGSLIGGVIGLKIATGIFGAPVSSALLPRLIVAASMIIGVVTAAVTFVLGTGLLGWMAGFVLETIKTGSAAEIKRAEQTHKI